MARAVTKAQVLVVKTATEAPAKEVSAADKTATHPVDNLALAQTTTAPVEIRAVDLAVHLTTTDRPPARVASVVLTTTDLPLDRAALVALALTTTDLLLDKAALVVLALTTTAAQSDKDLATTPTVMTHLPRDLAPLTHTEAPAPQVVAHTVLATTRTTSPARPVPATATRLLPAAARVVCCLILNSLKQIKLTY